jgi:hypothetical protein
VQAVFGQATRVTVAIENAGDEPVALTGATIEEDTPEVDYNIVESSCSGVLDGGASCQIILEFKPNDLGARSATLLVTPDIGDPLSIPLAGVALKPGALVVAPLDVPAPAAGQAVDYGPVLRENERMRS